MKWAIKTDVGVVRSENQDKATVVFNEDAILAILCDGMGGHAGGSFASETTINVFATEFKKGVEEAKIAEWFGETLKKAKKEMAKFAVKDSKLLDMGTTVTAAVILTDIIYIFNVGDSRTYAYNGLLFQLTKDHNLRNYYIDKYHYSPEEAAKIMGAMALTSALGPKKSTSVDSFILERDENTKYIVLTSDGIHDYVAKPKFEAILSTQDSLEDKAQELIKQSIRGKSSDNLTVIIVDLED